VSLTSIVFSKNRPAQLDLLLRSMKRNAPAFVRTPPTVICKVTDEYNKGYDILEEEHRDVWYWREATGWRTFRDTVQRRLEMVPEGDQVAFFVDDDVVYRPLPVANPGSWLDLFPDTLCFSLRLGLNTTGCYPMRAEQGTPLALVDGQYVRWDWRDESAKYDWAYPASLDGGIFRRDDLLRMLDGEPFTNPNELEDALVHGCRATVYPMEMASFERSVLVGIPVNVVNATHPNRHGESFRADPHELNEQYLAGGRLALAPIMDERVPKNAAHVEMLLSMEYPA
jgi:hypothetical protein